MKVSLPKGRAHGWGIAGEYLSKEIAKLAPVEGVTLHCARGNNFEPMDGGMWDSINIGYCFFEDNVTILNHTRQAARTWDFLAAGSTWCEHNLRIGGLTETCTILQGIDPAVFYPSPSPRVEEKFVVFSGGKFEIRKSQDIVIAAMKIFMERHSDAYLSCAWYNQWPFSLKTMAASRLIDFSYSDDCMSSLSNTLANNGIDLNRVILHPMMDNGLMRGAYLDSDIGLFPNRCEGGNNMAMCEYMACGKTVIASDMTGHANVVTPENSFPLTRYKTYQNGQGIWFEPEVSEVVELLETAYRNRQLVERKAIVAGNDMRRLSWQDAALKFHDIAVRLQRRHAEASTGPKGRKPARPIPLSGETGRQDSPGVRETSVLVALFKEGRYPEAELHARKITELFPGHAFGWKALGAALGSQGRIAESLEPMSKALNLSPEDAEAYSNFGSTLKNLGRTTEAEASYRRALEIDPVYAEAHYRLGDILKDLGRLDEAEASYRRALEIKTSLTSDN